MENENTNCLVGGDPPSQTHVGQNTLRVLLSKTSSRGRRFTGRERSQQSMSYLYPAIVILSAWICIAPIHPTGSGNVLEYRASVFGLPPRLRSLTLLVVLLRNC